MNSFKSFCKANIFTSVQKEVWIGWVSSLVEAYNMAIYSFLAPFLAKFLFHNAEKAVFFSYALILIASCFLYPLGAIYYGYIGDQQGRQRTCVYSTLGLAIATGLMGAIPFYMENSTWICFLVLICAQHFFSGGEYHGSIVFSLEHSERKQNGIMSSLSCLFAVFGLILANGLASLSSLIEYELAIRICFFVGGVGGFVSYLLKNHCRETPAFIAITKKPLETANWNVFIKSQWQKIGSVVFILAFFIVSYTYIFIFLPLIYLEGHNSQLFDTFKSLIAYGVFLVTAGLISDRIGQEETMLMGIKSFFIVIFPLSYLCESLLILQIILTACASLVIGPIHSWMLHQFEAKNRCRGIFISSAIATSIFGGSTVPICLMIFEKFHSSFACCVYPLLIATGSFFYLKHSRKTHEALV
jgi:MFS transporter, MHS family, proline/betaine transporter